jgi:GNAT superfamily N-acetyltransferase
VTTVSKLQALPRDVQELAESAVGEGFRFVQRLVEEFESGANTFGRPGEALFEVREAGKLVAIGGLNVDPFVALGSVGRVRRLYVHPAHRARGIGRSLVEAIESEAARTFEALRLFTDNDAAGRFYLRLGYEAIDRGSEASHFKYLRKTKPPSRSESRSN